MFQIEWSEDSTIRIYKWKVREGYPLSSGTVVFLYKSADDGGDETVKRYKATKSGVVKKRLKNENEIVQKGDGLLELSECAHNTVIKDLCAECGADLRKESEGNVSEASVPMIHSVPELKVTQKLAEKLGQADTERLLQDRKLVLLVDLDQTLIHTTNDNVPNNLKDVYHFQLYGPHSPWYHTRLRPGALQFLAKMDPKFELHICTFGARNYAHMIAQFLDEDGRYFSHRILSRDECLNATSKKDNLKALFPCGDSMVCIIDDREDVWNYAPNLIQVKPYHFFQHTGDINAPPGLAKHELDGKGVDFKELAFQKEREREEHEMEVAAAAAAAEKAEVEEAKKEVEEAKREVEEAKKEESPPEEAKEEEAAETIETEETTDDSKEKEDEEEKPKSPVAVEDDPSKSPPPEDFKSSDTEETLIEVEDPDDYLLYLESILLKIHEAFYEEFDRTKEIPDLKRLIPKVKSQVLVGKNLVFSGLVPNNVQLEQSKAYQIARSLGAAVFQDLRPTATHLVAATAGTFKVNRARKQPSIMVVTPEWLWSCAERWEAVDERLFTLQANKPSKMRQPPPHCSPEHPSSSSGNGGDSEPGPSYVPTKFIDTINPLLSFSDDDLESMDKEFNQFFESDESSSSEDMPIDIENPPMEKELLKRKRVEEEVEKRSKFFSQAPEQLNTSQLEYDETTQGDDDEDAANFSSSSDEMPSAKFRRGEDLPSDLDMEESSSEGSEEPIDEIDDGEWNMMGAALEREFLGMDENSKND